MPTKLNCKNCEHMYEGNYCPLCGQSSHEGRISASYFLHDIPHSIFHVDKGFFYTALLLFSKPGEMLKEFLEGKRVKYFRPFAYVILMSTINTFLSGWLLKAINAVHLQYNPQSTIVQNDSFFSHYFSLFIFIMIPITSAITYLFFIKKQYNFWEHCLINTYLAAQLNIIQVLTYLIAFIIVLFTHHFSNTYLEVCAHFLIVGLLYLYGSAFGFLMKDNTRLGWLILLLSIMNFILFIVYMKGFMLAGIIRF